MTTSRARRGEGAGGAPDQPGSPEDEAHRPATAPIDRLWRVLLDLSHEAIIGVDAEARCTFVNRRASELLGYSESEYLGSSLHALVHSTRPDGSPYPLEACPIYRACMSGQEARLLPETLWRKDGSPLAVLYSCVPLRDPSASSGQAGQVTGAIVTISDRTETTRAESERDRLQERLRSAEARYAAVFAGTADALLVANVAGRYVDANPAAERLLGYGRAEILGMGVTDLMVLSEGETRAMFAAFVRDGHWRGDVELRRKDGTTVVAEGRATTLALPDGPLFVSALRDISDRRRAEQASRILAEAGALLSSSLEYEATLDSIARLAVPALADWVFVEIVQEDGSIARLAIAHRDPALEALVREYGRRYPIDPDAPAGSGQVIRTGQSELISDLPDEFLQAVAQDDDHLRILRALGFRSAMIVPLIARGRILGDLAFVSDGADGRRFGPDDLALAEELAARATLAVDNARLYREARAAIGVRDEFLAVAAHELRTPITGLRGFAQVLVRRLRRGDEIEADALIGTVERIDRQAGKLAALVSQLLDVSRIEAGGLILDLCETDLAVLVADVAAAAQAGTRDHAIAVRHPARVLLQADPLRLEQVLANLLDNAIKYSPDGGPIDVELGYDGPDAVRIAVTDRGQGIPPEHRARIFDRYYKAHADRGISGMGLGLHVSREIVERHGGRLAADFPEHGGTRFVVTLPRKASCESGGPSADEIGQD